MRGRFLGLLTVVILVFSANSDASADEMFATRGQPIRELSHRVRVTIEDGVATYKVQRTFLNSGTRAEEVRLRLSLPHGAVATGLRIKAKSRWYDGELLPATKAEELYRELTGLGPSEPKDPALLYWRWTDELGLRIFPVFAGKSSTVEYTLTAPTSYADGSYVISYARMPSNKRMATPELQVLGDNIAHVRLDEKSIAQRMTSLAPPPRHPVLEKHNLAGTRVLVRTLRVPRDGGSKRPKLAKLRLEATHTWRGDVRARVIDPSGKVHTVQRANLSDSKDDLNESYEIALETDPAGPWHLLVDDFHPLDGGRLRSWSLTFGPSARYAERPNATIPQPTPARAGVADIYVRLKDQGTQTRFGRVALVDQKHFYRFEADIAPKLSTLPKSQSVVFAVDVSHTMDQDGIEAQLRIVKAYLSHLPDAKFALVAYGRRAELLSEGFVPASIFASLRADLAKRDALAPRNGSFLDRAVKYSAGLLAKRKGNKALVLLTDARLRRSWSNGKALQFIDKLKAKTPVHVVDVMWHNGNLRLKRDDNHSLFALAERRGGVSIRAEGLLSARDVPLQEEVRYLVRPDRLDNWTIDGLPADALMKAVADTEVALLEGQELRIMEQIPESPRSATLRGELWTQPVTYPVVQSEAFHRATAGFVFGEEHFHDLEPSEQFVIASYGRAVSPVTSYLAIEPGVRPSTIGLEDTGMGGFGRGAGGGMGSGYGGMRSGLDWNTISENLRGKCMRFSSGVAKLGLELQDREIADIEQQGDASNFAHCVYEAAWSYKLPERAGDTLKWLTIRARP